MGEHCTLKFDHIFKPYKISNICCSRKFIRSVGVWVAGWLVLSGYATLWLHLASCNLPDSQLISTQPEDGVEVGVELGNYIEPF